MRNLIYCQNVITLVPSKFNVKTTIEIIALLIRIVVIFVNSVLLICLERGHGATVNSQRTIITKE